MREDASRGNSGVYLNGRRLGWLELLRIRGFTTLPAGRYWQDAFDNFGLKGARPWGTFGCLLLKPIVRVVAITASALTNMNSGGGGGSGHNGVSGEC